MPIINNTQCYMKKGSINLSSANRAGESSCWTYSIDHLGCYHCYLIMKLSSDDHILGRSWKEIVNTKKLPWFPLVIFCHQTSLLSVICGNEAKFCVTWYTIFCFVFKRHPRVIPLISKRLRSSSENCYG